MTTSTHDDQKPIRAPAGLGQRGGRYWRDVLRAYEIAVDERELLHELCRTLDVIEELHRAASTAPMVEGRYGPTVNPAVRELRGQRAEARHLAAALALPHPEGGHVGSGASQRALAAAQQRWRIDAEERTRRRGA